MEANKMPYATHPDGFLLRFKGKLAVKSPRASVPVSSSEGARRYASKKAEVEKLWRELFSDIKDWTDHRSDKPNPRFPDFRHKKHTQKALWLNSELNPPWVKEMVAALPPGRIPLSAFARNQQLLRFAQAGQYEKTIELFEKMQRNGESVDKFTFCPVLKACTKLGLLHQGRRIHQMMQPGFRTDLFIGSSLVDMYAKCGSIEEAEGVFNQMPTRNVVAWNAMIVGYVKCREGQKALKLFGEMRAQGWDPDPVTFVGVLNACATVAALEIGRRIHDEITNRGYDSEVVVGTCLVDMYAKCGSIEEAEIVFDQMPTRNVVAWNAMIGGYVKCGEGQKALELLGKMEVQGVDPDPVTFVGVLNACASVAALEVGRRIHGEITSRGYESEVIGNCLVDMYVKCGSIEEAEIVFNQMPTRNVIAWNAMIAGYVKCGDGIKALELFGKMQAQGLDPDPVTFVGVLNACASVAALEMGRRTHDEIILRGYESEVFVGSSLVDMYAKCGSVEEAEIVFDQMPTRNVVAWTAMIVGYAKCGDGQKALELFGKMQAQGVAPDPVTFVGVLNACASLTAIEVGRRIHDEITRRGYESEVVVGNCLVDMYAKCGSIQEAEMVFNHMPTRNVVAWNTMIGGYAKCGDGQKALGLFWKMEAERVDPTPVTFVGVLKACADVAALKIGRRVHDEIICRGYESEIVVGNCLIDMYAKCGSIEEAEKVFNRMPMRDVVSWNAMLAAYGIHGHAREALETFERMCKVVEVNVVTFVSLLSACSHGGLEDEGLQYFKSMSAVYSITPTMEHFACVVDLLGRAGHLVDAEDLIMSMPMDPDTTVWMALLGACRTHVNVEVGERCVKRVLELDPDCAAAYVLMSDIYVAAGKLDSSAKFNRERLKKKPGHTCIEVGAQLHSFVVDDDAHPQIAEIHAEL